MSSPDDDSPSDEEASDEERAEEQPADDRPFTDADELGAELTGDVSDADRARLLASLIRADLSATRPGAVLSAFESAAASERLRLAFAWTLALDDDDLAGWILGDAARRAQAARIVQRMAPPDPSPFHSAPAMSLVKRYRSEGWGQHEYQVIIVPGYTPADTKTASPGVHETARRRLEAAITDYAQGKAPFVLVTGANVYPAGTPYYEAIEMKTELRLMGLPEDRILVEARARHSTTNLRNAGRIMLAHGMTRALITTMGGGLAGSDLFGQDFYFQNPTMSTFHKRCVDTLGYRVGELSKVGPHHTAFEPSPDVKRIGFRDALDP